jgi:hypothetical protein
METIAVSEKQKGHQFKDRVDRWICRFFSLVVLLYILGMGVLTYTGTQIGGVVGCIIFLLALTEFIRGVSEPGLIKYFLVSIITGERDQ